MNLTAVNHAADNIRVLAASMVEKAKSGHPGGAMGGADFVNVLYSQFLITDPDVTDSSLIPVICHLCSTVSSLCSDIILSTNFSSSVSGALRRQAIPSFTPSVEWRTLPGLLARVILWL